MSRARTDQACLEAQMQQQIAQGLNAELAVPCPDCGVESGRACRDSLDRAVRTHLARSVASNRRDTEPCPAPTESLERASARAFAESLRAPINWPTFDGIADAAERIMAASGVCLGCFSRRDADGVIAHRPLCFYKTPTASDCAPSPAASAPDAVASTPVEKLCANCSQPLGYGTKVLGNVVIGWHCGDCWSSVNLWDPEQSRTLDQRIAETKSDDATECAWSTPTSDGEGWT